VVTGLHPRKSGRTPCRWRTVPLFFAPALLLASAPSPQAGAHLDGLLSNPPFGALQASSRNPENPATDSFELRGIVVLGAKPAFSIHDATSNRAVWIGLDETLNGIRVRNYDEAHQTVDLIKEGKAMTLQLKRSVVLTQSPSRPAKPQEDTSTAPVEKSAAASHATLRSIRDGLRSSRAQQRERQSAAIPQ
jgi:hypothetical protein